MQNIKTIALGLVITIILTGCSVIPGLNNQSSTATPSPTTGGSNATSETSSGDKSGNWPSDVPSQTGAYEFNYAKYIKTYSLSYKLKTNSKTLAQIHDDEITLLKSTGWTVGEKNVLDITLSISEQLTKDTRTITVTSTKATVVDDFASISFYISDTTSGI